jgi:hypothetical protein
MKSGLTRSEWNTLGFLGKKYDLAALENPLSRVLLGDCRLDSSVAEFPLGHFRKRRSENNSNSEDMGQRARREHPRLVSIVRGNEGDATSSKDWFSTTNRHPGQLRGYGGTFDEGDNDYY